ncbi:CPBP family intramembrane metalloprotease [Paraclostridium bifermentans]|uniref:CPBP family intramembrane metalloprotease n=1 Tax=Paraclostridium bifermentans TaxID=1490 RepID=A0AA44IHX3_PARBF|nr:CPBP family glutamic-type intramembrane protease [Paraclostridium bifermentans]MBN8048909.1 CPBP family intramembrane metalloprotease [Paraclostridium bifermentans]NME10480.1 CPBP family intramembrane metalloprotease [Paraclostridium bifermentans]
MNQIITKYQLKLFPVIVSMLLLLVTFKIDLIKSDTMGLYIFKIVSVPLLSIISLVIAFGKSGLNDAFSKPIKPFKNIAVWYIVSLIASFISGVLLTTVFKLNLHNNPGSEHIVQTLISLPFVLLFEEVISIFVLLVISNFTYKKTDNLKLANAIGIILSSIFFGLLHYSTYFSGNVMHTLIHIIFVQGLARIFFNLAALKSNSIIVPWIVHVVFDFTTFGLGTVMLFSLI